MPLRIVRNDITTMKVDAIVNAANAIKIGAGQIGKFESTDKGAAE